MSRLLSFTCNSSICLLIILHFVWLLLLTTATAKPTASPADGNQHITSFVNQTSKARPRKEFDFQRNEAEATNAVQLRQLFSGLLQLPATRLDDALDNSLAQSDDAPASARNMLDDELKLDMLSEQHEGSTESPDAWHRIKLNIPVLEPVKHLVNAVGGGGVNDTHVRINHHRLLGHQGVHHSPHANHSENSSMAIETEEDRETAIDSTDFNVLETLGTTGTVLWGFLQNLRTIFAASAGTASSASSGGGGGGGAGSK